eukprot:COSAG04_NODE_1184_length_7885_cov_98.186874_6_plen_222_part_00
MSPAKKKRRCAPNQEGAKLANNAHDLTKKGISVLGKAVAAERRQHMEPGDGGKLQLAVFVRTVGAGIEHDRVNSCVLGELPAHGMAKLFFTLTALLMRLEEHGAMDDEGVKQALIAMILSALNRGANPRPARTLPAQDLTRARPAPRRRSPRLRQGQHEADLVAADGRVEGAQDRGLDGARPRSPPLPPPMPPPVAQNLLSALRVPAEPQGARRRRPRRPD